MFFTAYRAAVADRALVEARSKRSRIACVRRGRSRTVQACRINKFLKLRINARRCVSAHHQVCGVCFRLVLPLTPTTLTKARA